MVVSLEAFGQVDVGHEAHIGFVDPHAKGDRGHHDHAAAQAEALQGLPPRFGVHAGVIRDRIDAGGLEFSGHPVHPVAGAGVDDP